MQRQIFSLRGKTVTSKNYDIMKSYRLRPRNVEIDLNLSPLPSLHSGETVGRNDRDEYAYKKFSIG